MKSSLLSILCLICLNTFAQWPSGGGNWGSSSKMNVGRFYGKVVDSLSGKPVEYAVVKITGSKWDTITKSLKPAVLGGMMSEGNGDFSIDQLPVMGKMKLIISSIGYITYEKEISFNLDMQKLMSSGKDGNWAQALNNVDKDLGNIKLRQDNKLLTEVIIDGSDPDVVIKLDRKIYNVEKNITATGGTAEDVMKQVPSVSVDIDGNVTLRNAAPQILIDGKPTTLTLDQIPADAIQSVEVITNPSAKYDASGGGGGILNIVLKKNRKPGYNGSLRAGIDSRLAWNGGADLNAREGKVNFFISAMFNQRNSVTNGRTERHNLIETPLTNMYQDELSTTGGFFAFGRLGFDWFMNNRNTLTFSGNYVRGQFTPENDLDSRTDTLYWPVVSSSYNRLSMTERGFTNLGGSVQFKHLFTKAGKELTADVNYNQSTSYGLGAFETKYFDQNANEIAFLEQTQDGEGANQFYSAQTDYVNPINEKTKLEMGIKGSYRTMLTKTMNYDKNPATGELTLIKSQSANYEFMDQIYAGYVTFGKQYKKVSFQLGLRGESSVYYGELIDSNQTFQNLYPIEIFPSTFFTWQMNSKQDLQFSYSRRINRPGFMQLIPFTDYSDSLNLKRGNPSLKPEFTHAFEISYLNTFSRGNSLLGSVYLKTTNDLMTTYQLVEFDTVLNKMAVVSTYENANSSVVYGAELTLRKTLKSWMDYSINLNGYSSFIDAGNIDSALQNEQMSWFVKVNTTYKLSKSFTLQVSGDYRSKSAISSGGGGRSDRGGMSWGGGSGMGAWFGGSTANVQGYVKAKWGVEASLRFEFMKEKKASLTISIRDIFASDNNVTYSESPFFTQTTERLRDARLVKLNFSYRFGKFDASIFKRKNMKMNTDGMDLGM